MKVKNIIWEDTVNYRKPSLFIGTAYCSMKCGKKNCQNAKLLASPDIKIDDCEIIRKYKANPLTEAIVFGGLEPFEQIPELLNFFSALDMLDVRDDVVIYTGYTEEELEDCWGLPDYFRKRNSMRDLIIKYGRYIPDLPSDKIDEVLGVKLASANQYAKIYRKVASINIRMKKNINYWIS